MEGAKDITVVPRYHVDNPRAPAVVHLVNRSYRRSDEAMEKKTGFVLGLGRSLYGRTISKATLLAPGKEPVMIEAQANEDGTKIAIPELDLWAVLRLE